MLTVFFSPNMVNASVRIGSLIGTFENRITRREGACRPGYGDKLASAWSWRGAVNGPGVLRWLGDKGQRVGILILLVSLLALYFNVRSYYMQQSSSMPNLISFGSKIYSDHQTASVALSWFNIGKGAVIRGRAFLFAVSKDQTKRHKIGEATISGGLPGNGAMAKMSVDMHQSLELFLVCASYVDDNDKNYQQGYLYHLGTPTDGPNEIPLVEELQSGRPSVEICND